MSLADCTRRRLGPWLRRRRSRNTRVTMEAGKNSCMVITSHPWHQWEPDLAEPEIYCQRQKQKKIKQALNTQRHSTKHTCTSALLSKTPKPWHIWNSLFCSKIHRSGRPLTTFYLTVSHIFLSLLLATSVSLLLLLPNYTWFLLSHSIHSGSSMLSLSSLFLKHC